MPKIGDFSWDVITFKDSVGAIACHFSFEHGKNFEFWTMEDYGKERSWIFYSSIDTTQGIERILGLWKDDDESLMIDNQHNVVLYNYTILKGKALGL